MRKNLVDVYGSSEWMERLEEELEGEREDYDRDLNILLVHRGLVHLDILLSSELAI